MTYATELLKKNFKGNVIIRFLGEYFSIRQPDSGLSVNPLYNGLVQSLIVNPTQVDLKRVNQTIASYSFKLVDFRGAITALTGDRAAIILNEEVEIWIGRSGENFPFSQYFKLPKVKVRKMDHNGNEYNFSCNESTDRMNVPIFNLTNKLGASILSGTTTFTLQDDITLWPTTGLGKVDDEFFSWTGKNNGLKHLTGVVRGEKGTTPVAHDLGATVYYAYDITDNPIDILLQILVSPGGGGAYDVLPYGMGIDQTLIDITEIENIRDNNFSGQQYSFTFYNIQNALKWLEEEILLPCNLRFRTSSSSKISLCLLDQAVFDSFSESIDEDTISAYPKWEVDQNKIVNSMEIQWDYNEASKKYERISLFTDTDSITEFGETKPYQVKFKGIKNSLSGQDIVDDMAQRFLERFKTPNPEISIKTQIDKHLLNVGDKVLLQSREIPSVSGTLNFATELEVISRAINFITADVNFKLAYTSYSGIRGCYIAPSDTITTVTNQKTIIVPAGRGDCYTVGWRMVLWNESTQSYETDPYNTIESISGDTITFTSNFSTTLIATTHRIKFVDYDDATQDQQRYCYISDSGLNFADGSATYKILF